MLEEPKKKKGCLGCSFPLLIGLTVVFLALIIVSFAAGPLGQNLLGDIGLPDWLSVPQPHPELPAEVVFHIFGFPITNSVIAAWVTIIFLVGFSYAVTRRMKLIPGRLQAAFEFLLGWLYNLCTSVAGEENGRKFFPIVATIFLFVGFNAWLGLIPGYGSITSTVEGEMIPGEKTTIMMTLEEHPISDILVTINDEEIGETEDGLISFTVPDSQQLEIVLGERESGEKFVIDLEEEVKTHTVHTGEGELELTVLAEVHLLRPANTDINMPFALAIVSFLFVEFTGIRRLGAGYLKKFFNTGEFRRGLKHLFKGNIKAAPLTLFTGGINIFTGFLEFFTELIRVISLTFRLFGNMTAGEILLLVAAFLVPWLFAVPFYGLELLIGFIQALIFAGLTLIFVTIAVIPHEEEAH